MRDTRPSMSNRTILTAFLAAAICVPVLALGAESQPPALVSGAAPAAKLEGIDPRPLAQIAPASDPAFRPRREPGALSDRIVSYTMKATLDPAPGVKTVTGTERVTWRNPGNTPVGELQFHLYLNAFRDRNSTFVRESGGKLRGDRMPDDGWGNIEVTSMATAAGEDLLPRMEFIQPDDGNAEDRTVARVPLSTPVAPGQTIELDIAFVSKLPRIFARTGFAGNFFFVGQWYPKLGVYEPKGMRGRAEAGWNCHQFHANSEFYADFGVFDVEVTVPQNFTVGATGALLGGRPSPDGGVTYHYRQADVHDFAWTADDNFVSGDRTVSIEGMPDVKVTALVQAEHASSLERHLDACEQSIRWFNSNIGPYPYETLTCVDPQEDGGGAGGMEYPTLITAGIETTWAGTLPEEDDPLLEVVIFHEFAHQYWYGMVASNEFEEPWMDEGITSYSEHLGIQDLWPFKRAAYIAYGGANVIRLPIDNPALAEFTRYAGTRSVVRRGPLINTSWGYKGDYGYAVNAYPRPAIALQSLQVLLGDETMGRVMRAYFDRWKFGHPTSQDFFDIASEVSGRDLAWYFDQAFRSDRLLDYGVQSVEKLDGKDETEVILERVGDAVFPIDARVVRTDGSTDLLSWDGRSAQQVFLVASTPAVRRVDVYSGGVPMLDGFATNNTWTDHTDRAGPARIATECGLLFEHLTLLFAGAF